MCNVSLFLYLGLNIYNERQEKIGELSVEKEDLHKQLRQLQEKNQGEILLFMSCNLFYDTCYKISLL